MHEMHERSHMEKPFQDLSREPGGVAESGGKVNPMIGADWLKNITPREFALLGLNDLAYVKRVIANDEASFSIHGADGTQLAISPSRDVALAAIRQHDLEAV